MKKKYVAPEVRTLLIASDIICTSAMVNTNFTGEKEKLYMTDYSDEYGDKYGRGGR